MDSTADLETMYSDKYRLCFIDFNTNFAYFTSEDLSTQKGDDWDDAPWERRAGSPYGDTVKIAYYSTKLEPPTCWNTGEEVSVIHINHGMWYPWLRDWYDEEGVKIWAGDSIEEFKEKVWESGGEIYTKERASD